MLQLNTKIVYEQALRATKWYARLHVSDSQPPDTTDTYLDTT